MKRYLRALGWAIEKRFRVWGVELETSLPPEFYVSAHAEERLKTRMRVSDRKIPKVVMKAWYGRSVPIPKLHRAKYRSDHFHEKDRFARELMGYVFVFAVSRPRGALPPQKVLVTVL